MRRWPALESGPAAVILATMLPGMSGTEVLQRIRETPDHRNVPVMMLTHRNAEHDVVEALKLGASEYVTKPFLIGEVLERVSKLITPYEHPLESLLADLAACQATMAGCSSNQSPAPPLSRM